VLPSHLPLASLDTLVRDHCRLTAEDCAEAEPLEMLIGYNDGGEYGGTPSENPESDETDPLKRLRSGERLVIQLHLGLIQDEAQFIDGEAYTSTSKEIERDEEGDAPNEECFPDETGFFGVGLRLEGEHLALEPIRISGDFNGNICVEKAVFPASLAKRASAYLQGLA
jgi:hypothetical protein